MIATLTSASVDDPFVILVACILGLILITCGYFLGAFFKHVAVRDAEFAAWREAERLFRAREELRLRDEKEQAPPIPGALTRDLCQH